MTASSHSSRGPRPQSRTPDYSAIVPAPFGALGVRLQGGLLAGLDFLPPGTRLLRSAAAASVEAELQAYFGDPGHVFGLPLALTGTPFRMKVWQVLLAIPAGETRTYGEVAAQVGSGPRPVGQAVGDNPVPIVIPCHRVLAARGLGGFMHGSEGFAMDVKRWLLRHEGIRL
jgi:methylated-DNA-[protein]-cysteine S-methyltransferase